MASRRTCTSTEGTQPNTTHFLFLVRHGERADQKETKDAFRASVFPRHDPPLRSVFSNYMKEKKMKKSEGKEGEEYHAENVEDTTGDAALDRCSAIINQYINMRGAIEATVIGTTAQTTDGNVDDGVEGTPTSVGLWTSPLQRCVTTLAHIAQRLPSNVLASAAAAPATEPKISEADASPFVCDARLYEYLSDGLFPALPPSSPSPSAKKAARGQQKGGAGCIKVDKGAADESKEGHVEESRNEDASPAVAVAAPPHPIPYVYRTGTEHSNGSPSGPSECAVSPPPPHAARCVFADPSCGAVVPSLSPTTSREEREIEIKAAQQSALSYIHGRFPETRPAAEGRFANFIDSHIGAHCRANQSPDGKNAPYEHCNASIICSHQFGVSAMLGHLLRGRMNKAMPLPRADEVTGEEENASKSGGKFDWRKAASDVWATTMAARLGALPNTSSGNSTTCKNDGNSTVAPQFTPRIDTSSVTLLVIHRDAATSELVCTPVTVGEN